MKAEIKTRNYYCSNDLRIDACLIETLGEFEIVVENIDNDEQYFKAHYAEHKKAMKFFSALTVLFYEMARYNMSLDEIKEFFQDKEHFSNNEIKIKEVAL